MFIFLTYLHFVQGVVARPCLCSIRPTVGAPECQGQATSEGITHSHIWQLMLAGGWDLSWGCGQEHPQVVLPCGWASSRYGGWVPREEFWERGELAEVLAYHLLWLCLGSQWVSFMAFTHQGHINVTLILRGEEIDLTSWWVVKVLELVGWKILQ